MVVPTATPIPTTDWLVTIVLNVTIGPCAGVPRVAALALKILPFQTSVTAPRRRGICASGGAVFSHLVTGAPVA
jgi:branched-subunit amino acid permease